MKKPGKSKTKISEEYVKNNWRYIITNMSVSGSRQKVNLGNQYET